MEEVTEDELNLSLEWDSRNFGEKHFLPDGDKYKVILHFLSYEIFFVAISHFEQKIILIIKNLC